MVLWIGNYLFNPMSKSWAQTLNENEQSSDDFLLRDYYDSNSLAKKSDLLNESEAIEVFQNFENKLVQDGLKHLQHAKLYLLNGNLIKAKRELAKIPLKNQVSSLVRDRYLAIIYFLSDEFSKSLQLLEKKDFNEGLIYPHICTLKMANLLALKQLNALESETAKCQSFLNSKYQPNFLWPESLISIFKKNQLVIQGSTVASLAPYRTTIEDTKLWLKMVLFLNQEKKVLNEIPFIPGEYFQSQIVRELIGLLYYRSGQRDKGLSFVEDLPSANAENIKGNILLKNGQNELAYGHFQLALKNKANSQNAIERALPLSWLLQKWSEGLELTSKLLPELNPAPLFLQKRAGLSLAFLTQMDKPFLVYKELQKSNNLFGDLVPLEWAQLHAYNALIIGDEERLEHYGSRACEQFDGLNCWLQMQISHWEDFKKTIERNDSIHEKTELNLENVKQKNDIIPITGPVLVDQKDIEELDESIENNISW
jgi:hypothetical protein